MKKFRKGTRYVETKFDKFSKEFWAMPSKDKPATTTQPSIRNLVSNFKPIVKPVVDKIKGGIQRYKQGLEEQRNYKLDREWKQSKGEQIDVKDPRYSRYTQKNK